MMVVHVELAEANAFVAEHHRHSERVTGHRFSIGVLDRAGILVGVAIVGRAVARGSDVPSLVEALRVCTLGGPNQCSFLYGACARAARALGYAEIQTYTTVEESGISLRAAGWEEVGRVRARDWTRTGHLFRSLSEHEAQDRVRWRRLLSIREDPSLTLRARTQLVK